MKGPGGTGHSRPAALFLAVAGFCTAGTTTAQEIQDRPEKKKTWSNSTEFSLVLTEGNSDTDAFGFNDTFTREKGKSKFQARLRATRTNTADDRFFQVDPGFTWDPGETPTDFTYSLVEPVKEPDVEKYFIEGRFEKRIKEAFSWNAGASWDRNRDAGILSRSIVFGGVGHIWWNRDDHKFNTSYSLSFTDREEEEPDPEKEDRFGGLRLELHYLKTWFGTTTFENNWTTNLSLKDTSDYSSDMVNSIAVAINTIFSLKFSIQWLYNNEPALDDFDLVAQVNLIDPDGIPGNGDEFFETVPSGGAEIELGTVRARKESLDTIVNTSLVIKF